jgi:hypothetical protein
LLFKNIFGLKKHNVKEIYIYINMFLNKKLFLKNNAIPNNNYMVQIYWRREQKLINSWYDDAGSLPDM